MRVTKPFNVKNIIITAVDIASCIVLLTKDEWCDARFSRRIGRQTFLSTFFNKLMMKELSVQDCGLKRTGYSVVSTLKYFDMVKQMLLVYYIFLYGIWTNDLVERKSTPYIIIVLTKLSSSIHN